MSIASPMTLSHSGISNKDNFDLFLDDPYIKEDLTSIIPDYAPNGVICSIDVILDSVTPCQIKINGGTW